MRKTSFDTLALVFFIQFANTAILTTEHINQICINNDIPFSKQATPMAVGNFQEVIQNSKYFVDKSMLIQQLLENCKKGTIKAVTMPRKWGKSFNLNMVRFFIQRQLHENGSQIPIHETPSYKFFVEGIIPETGQNLNQLPLISKQKKFIEEHLGKHDVIFIDFSRIYAKEPTFQFLYDEFRKEMARIFSEHEYVTMIWNRVIEDANSTDLEKTEASIKLQRFDDIFSEKDLQRSDVIRAVVFLAETMAEFSGKTPIIFLDEYDKFANIVYFSKTMNFSAEDIKLVKNFTNEFTQLTFQAHPDLFSLAIVTGILRISEDTFVSGAINITEYNILYGKDLYPYYGFSTGEVELLLKERRLEHEGKNVTEWYHGYKFLDHPVALYSPWAIINFINKKKFGDYWVKSGSTVFMKDLCQYTPIRRLFESLISEKRFPVDETAIVPNHREFELIHELIEGNVTRNLNSTIKHVLIIVLYNAGYLTPTDDSTPTNIRLKFTNMEVTHFIAMKLLEFYKTYLGDDLFRLVTKSSGSLNYFILKDENSSASVLCEDIKITFRRICSFHNVRLNQQEKPEKNEIVMYHTMLIPALMLHEKFKYIVRDTLNETLISHRNRMDMELERHERVLIIVFKFSDENMKELTSRDQTEYKKYFAEKTSINIIKYLTIRVDKRGNVEINSSMKKRN